MERSVRFRSVAPRAIAGQPNGNGDGLEGGWTTKRHVGRNDAVHGQHMTSTCLRNHQLAAGENHHKHVRSSNQRVVTDSRKLVQRSAHLNRVSRTGIARRTSFHHADAASRVPYIALSKWPHVPSTKCAQDTSHLATRTYPWEATVQERFGTCLFPDGHMFSPYKCASAHVPRSHRKNLRRSHCCQRDGAMNENLLGRCMALPLFSNLSSVFFELFTSRTTISAAATKPVRLSHLVFHV